MAKSRFLVRERATRPNPVREFGVGLGDSSATDENAQQRLRAGDCP